jgi:hypothetical protein
MNFFLETTLWDNAAIPNHTYLLTDDKSRMVAYIPLGKTQVFTFKTPIKFSTRGRKFQKIDNSFGYVMPSIAKTTDSTALAATSTARTIMVQGSTGKSYTLTEQGKSWTCTCSGFSFRGKCKHLESVPK